MAAVPMLTPNDPKAPKFSGNDRTLVQFLDDYSRMADAAQLSPYQKCYKLAGYLSTEVREDLEQYEEYSGLTETSATADSWTKLVDRFFKDYPNAKRAREITRDDYNSFVSRSETREIKTEDELNAFTREFRRYTTQLIKNNLLAKPDVATTFYRLLLKDIGHDLTLALKLQKPNSDDFELEEIVESARRLIKKRSNNTGIGLVFEPIIMTANIATTNPAPLSQVIKQEEPLSAKFQALMTRIEALEKERDNLLGKKKAYNANASAGTTRSSTSDGVICYYCPADGHTMGQCPLLEEDLKKGRCKRNENNRIVFPDGSRIPSGPGRKMAEAVAEWNKTKENAAAVHSVSAMLVEVSDELVHETAPAAYAPVFTTREAEQSWWAFMMDQAAAYQQAAAGRPGLRSQNKKAEEKVPGGERIDSSSSKRDVPPHVGKKPVSSEFEPRATTPRRAETAKEVISESPATPETQAQEIREGTARMAPPIETAQPARPQFRVQAPVEREGTAKKIADRAMDAQVVCTLEELAAIAPELQRYIRMRVTPKRVAAGSVEEGDVEVWHYRVVDGPESTWTPDTVTAQISMPLRYLDCRIGKFEVEGVLDGGAQIVIISKKLWVDLERPIDQNFPRVTLEAANNTTERTVGLCANLEVTIFDITFFLQAHVVEEAPFDLLLGRPFLSLAKAKEEALMDGGSIITLHDPNSDIALRAPTKARSNRRRTEKGQKDTIGAAFQSHF